MVDLVAEIEPARSPIIGDTTNRFAFVRATRHMLRYLRIPIVRASRYSREYAPALWNASCCW